MQIGLFSFIGVCILSAVHVLGAQFGQKILHNSLWLSFAGGISVAYVFTDILPFLAENQVTLGSELSHHVVFLDFLEKESFVFALLGLLVFYSLEVFALQSRGGSKHSRTQTDLLTYKIHALVFIVYNFVLGLLLANRIETSPISFATYLMAMSLHILINDNNLQQHHKTNYTQSTRWYLILSLLVGWALGLQFLLPKWIISILFSLVSGSIIVNVIQEELPKQDQSKVFWFNFGAILCALLLLRV